MLYARLSSHFQAASKVLTNNYFIRKMNELLQKHGCANVFTIPEGLKELMTDITREVLRDQPPKIFDYIANYLSVLIITREHGLLAVKILDDLCDCRPSVSEHLLQMGMDRPQAETLAEIIKEEIESIEPTEGKETVKESLILKKILQRTVLDEEMTAHVCQVARNAYRDYWYRKKLMEKNLNVQPEATWEIAAERTLELYKKTKPSFNELNRATEKIQAAYKGYYVRRKMLRHLKPKKKTGPQVELPGPPLDVAGSREIDLGPLLDLTIRDEDAAVNLMFKDVVGKKLGIQYDHMKTITHVNESELVEKRNTRFAPSSGEITPSNRTDDLAPPDLPPDLPPSDDAAGNSFTSTGKDIDTDAGVKIPTQKHPQTLFSVPPSHGASTTVSENQEMDAPLNKISFAEPFEAVLDEPAEVPEEIFNEVLEDVNESKSDKEGKASEGSDRGEMMEDDAQEVPEDIPDDFTDGEGTTPAASMPSSAPETDIEEAGDVTIEDAE